MSCRSSSVHRQRRLLLDRAIRGKLRSDAPFIHWDGLIDTIQNVPECWSLIIGCVCHDRVCDLQGMEEFLDMFGPDGFTPLHFAAALGFKQVSEYLLEHGANPSKGNAVSKLPPLSPSAPLLSRPSLYNNPAFGITPLFLSASKGHVEVVDLFLRYGADIDSEVILMSPGLEQLCTFDQNGEHLNLDVFPAWARITAIEEAAMEGHFEVVKQLLKAGAMLRSSVIAAALQGHSSIVKVLLGIGWPSCREHDAGVIQASAYGPVGKDGTSSLSVVLEHSAMDVRLSEYASAAVQWALHLVCMREPTDENELSKIQVLLQHGADVNGFISTPAAHIQPDEDIATSSSCGIACMVFNRWYSAQFRQDTGSKLEGPPIVLAIRAHNLEVALFLLQCGCSTDLPDGRTVRQELDFAVASPDGSLLSGSGLYDSFIELLTVAEHAKVASLQVLCRRCIIQHAPGPKRIQRLPFPAPVTKFLLFAVD